MKKQDFPLLRDSSLIYLDSAATTQKPETVIDAIQRFYCCEYATVHRGIYSLSKHATEHYQNVRLRLQKFLHAESIQEIIFTRGTTAALNLVARSYGEIAVGEGDKILISAIEHHSNIVPWQMLASRKKAHLIPIPVNDEGEIIFDAFEKLLDSRVKIVSVGHVSNVLGTIQPVAKMIQAAHRVGAKVCLDGAQYVAHAPLNVSELDADFYAFSSHKMYGPTSIGVLFGKKELLEKMEPLEGGGDMIEKVTLEKTTYASLPLKFEAGTPSIAEVIGFGAAIDYLQSVGLEAIRHHERELTRYAFEKLASMEEVRILGSKKERGSLISFVIEGIHPLDLASLLDCKKIAIRSGHLCSQPAMERCGITSACRISFGVYNTKEEVDQFYEALKSVMRSIV